MKFCRFMAFIFLALGLQAQAAKKPQVYGNPSAPRGGTIYQNLNAEPEGLNPISSNEAVTRFVMDYVSEGLITQNPETLEYEPALAEKWEISKDGLVFTFHLRHDAVFSDGHPITSDDARFSVECVKNPAFKAVQRMPYYDDIAKIETPDDWTIRFTMKKKYYLNLDVLGSGGFTPIVPKHIYSDPTKPLGKVLVGSGPYKVEAYNRGKDIQLVRNDKWWGYKAKDPLHVGTYNFDRVVFRFIQERNLQIEMVKKGQIDFLDDLSPEQFMVKAVDAPFGTEIVKHKEENQDASKKTYGFVAWNFKNPIFQDRDTRLALAHLMNRELMNEKFRYGMTDLAAGPSYLRNAEIADPAVKPLKFDPKVAGDLLKKAGWEDKEKTGVLQKMINGKKTEFRFALLLPSRDMEKYFTIYKEDLKKAGIDMEIKNIEWNAFVKLLDEQKFDAITMRWVVGSLEADQKQIWHSGSAQPGGSNFISYKNPAVDKLIDAAREEMNTPRRRKMWRQVYKLIAEDAPYAWMFSDRYDLYCSWKHIGMVKGTYKYSRGTEYWWRTP